MSFLHVSETGVGSHGIHRNAEPAQHFGQIQPVDAAERVQAVDGRQRSVALDIRQTADKHHEFRVVVSFGDLLAGKFYVAKAQAQPFPRPAKALTRVLHAMILSRVMG